MLGKKFENIHNGKIIVITKLEITDEGYRYWRGQTVDDPVNWSFYTEKDFEKHWIEINTGEEE